MKPCVPLLACLTLLLAGCQQDNPAVTPPPTESGSGPSEGSPSSVQRQVALNFDYPLYPSNSTARQGIWLVTSSKPDVLPEVFKVALVQDNAVVLEKTLPGRGIILPASDGNATVWSVANNWEFKLTRIQSDGTTTEQSFGFDGAYMERGVVDAQGNVWFLKDTSLGNGTISAVLVRADFQAGTTTVVDSKRPYTGLERVNMSPDGRTLTILPYMQNHPTPPSGYGENLSLQRVDTVTGSVTDVAIKAKLAYITSVATANDATVYVGQSGASALRIGADGRVIGLSTPSDSAVVGLDQLKSDTLWMLTASGVLRLDLATNQTYTVKTDPAFTASTDLSGGIWAVTTNYIYNPAEPNTTPKYVANLIK